jgi:hypothetical protein
MARPIIFSAKIIRRGYMLRLQNRRVEVFPTDTGVAIRFKRLGGDGEPRVVKTELALSMDAALGMVGMIEQVHEDELARSKVPKSTRRKSNGKDKDQSEEA